MLPKIVLGASQPYDILHDPFWQFVINVAVAFIIGIVGTITAVWIFRKQRNIKEISYQIISQAPIASISKDVEDRVEIRFDGKLVKDISLIVLKVWNSGNVAVKRDDFDEPITLVFKGGAVIGSDVLSTTPNGLIDPRDIILEQESVRLPKLLLNPKESINLKVLVTELKGKITGEARIVDGKMTEESSANQSAFIWRLVLILFSLILAGSFIAVVGTVILGGVPTSLLLTIFTSVVAFMAGLLAPSPTSPPEKP